MRAYLKSSNRFTTVLIIVLALSLGLNGYLLKEDFNHQAEQGLNEYNNIQKKYHHFAHIHRGLQELLQRNEITQADEVFLLKTSGELEMYIQEAQSDDLKNIFQKTHSSYYFIIQQNVERTARPFNKATRNIFLNEAVELTGYMVEDLQYLVDELGDPRQEKLLQLKWAEKLYEENSPIVNIFLDRNDERVMFAR